MHLLTNIQRKELEHAGREFGTPFHYPPFDGNPKEGFFDIHEFKEKPEFQKFLGIIENIGVHYEYAYKKNDKTKRIFMAVTVME